MQSKSETKSESLSVMFSYLFPWGRTRHRMLSAATAVTIVTTAQTKSWCGKSNSLMTATSQGPLSSTCRYETHLIVSFLLTFRSSPKPFRQASRLEAYNTARPAKGFSIMSPRPLRPTRTRSSKWKWRDWNDGRAPSAACGARSVVVSRTLPLRFNPSPRHDLNPTQGSQRDKKPGRNKVNIGIIFGFNTYIR